MNTLSIAIIAYLLIATPLGILLGQALKANRRRYPSLERKER